MIKIRLYACILKDGSSTISIKHSHIDKAIWSGSILIDDVVDIRPAIQWAEETIAEKLPNILIHIALNKMRIVETPVRLRFDGRIYKDGTVDKLKITIMGGSGRDYFAEKDTVLYQTMIQLFKQGFRCDSNYGVDQELIQRIKKN
ncbi:hypothetical protein D3C78_20210 [compost metagenome]